MRIVGGLYRGRPLAAPRDRTIRPTGDRVREALFNILCQGRLLEGRGDLVDGAVVLDAFVGSGALALEALSRGAVRAHGMDIARAALRLAARNAASLAAQDRLILRKADARRPPPAPEAASLALLDPPYGKDMVAAAIAGLAQAGWLSDDAVIVVESAATDAPPESPGWMSLDRRSYGDTALTFLVRQGPS